MGRFKFGNTKVYVVPGCAHRFSAKKDAIFYCEQHGIDWSEVEVYDSTKEYKRWLELQTLEKNCEITNLRRQVEYEIIPAAYETRLVKTKKVKIWPVFEAERNGVYFSTKKEAVAYCKNNGLPTRDISSIIKYEPVYKTLCVEKNAVYTADFVYYENGQLVVEDVKSDITRKEADYVLRRKLMLYRHGIKIKET